MPAPVDAPAKDGAAPAKDEPKPADAAAKHGAPKKEEELSDEDKELVAELQLLVDRVQDADTSLHVVALETMRTLIRTATSSMTSVPKPLKFLRTHYDTLVKAYEAMAEGRAKHFLADIVSVLAMTVPTAGKRPSLKYRLLGSAEPLASWGHEYVRFLAAELALEYKDRVVASGLTSTEDEDAYRDLLNVAAEVVPFFMTHNAEADACDLLMEIDRVRDILPHIDAANYVRVCLYLMSCVSYVPEPEDRAILQTVMDAYLKLGLRADAILVALRMNSLDAVQSIFNGSTDSVEKKQLAYILARQQVRIETGDADLDDILNNVRLTERFIALGRELEVLEPKVPEDVYKSHLETTRALGAQQADSAKQNLAATFTNAFLNAGFGKDKILGDDENAWITKHKDHGKISATAALGMILMWDVEVGLTKIDKFMYVTDEYVKAGALLALGIVTSSVRNDCDPAQALLADYVVDNNATIRGGALTSLAMAYAGSNRADIIDMILPTVGDTSLSPELVGLAALAIGVVGVGSCSESASSTILETLLERDAAQLSKSAFARFISLGMGLLFLGRQEAAEAVLEGLKAVAEPVGKQAVTVLEMCAYAGTGNVLKIQKMLQLCTDHIDPEKDSDLHQTFAVLGISLIAMGEDIGSEMAYRCFNHLMHYGEAVIRRAVPLALGLLCVSKPLELTIVDTLSKYSHDNDLEVAQSAVFALGLIGAGTNNARLAQMLRQLASYYQKEPNTLFVVRVAQGLLHMAKGTVSLNPYHSNRLLMSPVAVAGLLSAIVAMTDPKSTLMDKYHYLLFYLSIATFPRMLVTLDETGKAVPVSVRVGQAVDVVGQAGRPKTITGFQTHTTPVLLGQGERAELATEEYIPVSKVLEGFVVIKKNPNYVVEADSKYIPNSKALEPSIVLKKKEDDDKQGSGSSAEGAGAPKQ